MKTRLDPEQYEALLASLERLHACPSLDAFPRAVLAEVARLVPCESAAYNEFHPAQNRAIALVEPAPPDFAALLARWQTCFQENPILRYAHETGDGSAHQISDFLTGPEFHRLALYTEVFQPMQIEHQIAFLLGEPGGVSVGVALNRRLSAFNETERQILNHLRPHLARAYARLVQLADAGTLLTPLHPALGSPGEDVILISHRDVILHASPRAAQWLARYFGWQPAAPLPVPLAAWLVRQRAGESAPFLREGEGRRLHARLVERAGQSFSTLLFTEEIVALDPEACARAGLTPAESSVLGWLAQGKSNREIATICQGSEDTVKKHTRSILSKLGVDNRTAAALQARARLAARE